MDTDTLPATGSEKTIHIHFLGPCPNARHLHTKLLEQAGGGGGGTGRVSVLMGFALGVARPLVFGWWVLILLLPRGLGVVGINLAYIMGGRLNGFASSFCLTVWRDHRMSPGVGSCAVVVFRSSSLIQFFCLRRVPFIFFENEVVVKYHMRTHVGNIWGAGATAKRRNGRR